MKKKKFILATAAATAILSTFCFAACKDDNTADVPDGNTQIAAVYELYAESAQKSGGEVLTYEQWLESIKGPQGATGATGATGKSAYDIAKENGFTGTEAEWLASLKGDDGTNGTNGKSAYDIAKENGFTGTEAEWLESLKGEKGDDGSASDSPCVEGIYNTSDGLVIKFSDGTVKPVQNGGVTNQLLVLGENEIEVPITTDFNNLEFTSFSFYTFTSGTYLFKIANQDFLLEWSYPSSAGDGKAGTGSYDPYGEDGSVPPVETVNGVDYWGTKINVTSGYNHVIKLVNVGSSTTVKLIIEKIENN